MNDNEFHALRAKYGSGSVGGATQSESSTGLSKSTKGALYIGGAFLLALGAVVYYNRKDAQAEPEPLANPIEDKPEYTLDGDPVYIDSFFESNPDLPAEDVEEIQGLDVGEVFTGGGGAWASYVVERTR